MLWTKAEPDFAIGLAGAQRERLHGEDSTHAHTRSLLLAGAALGLLALPNLANAQPG